MFGAALVRIVEQTQRVRAAAERAERRVFAKTAFKIFTTARTLFVESQEPSAPGQTPHTRRIRVSRKTGKPLYSKGSIPGAIRYDATADGAVIGPMKSLAGTSGAAHEFGGQYKSQTFAERPFMGPALTEHIDDFAGEFSGSITQ